MKTHVPGEGVAASLMCDLRSLGRLGNRITTMGMNVN